MGDYRPQSADGEYITNPYTNYVAISSFVGSPIIESTFRIRESEGSGPANLGAGPSGRLRLPYGRAADFQPDLIYPVFG